jgi:uncharacterized protein YciI
VKYFLCRLLPARPTFAQDMDARAAEAMKRHVAYWADLAERGVVILFGPVADPKGGWGVGILEVEDETEAHALTSKDPAILAALGARYEILPMPRIVIGRKRG